MSWYNANIGVNIQTPILISTKLINYFIDAKYSRSRKVT